MADSPISARDKNTSKEVSGQDGSRSGWIAVLSLWMHSFIWTGLFKGLGIMLPTLQHQFGTNTAVIGWMIGMIGAMIGLIGPFSGAIGRRYGTGVVTTVCGIVIGVSGVIGSISANAIQMASLLTVLSGTCLGINDILFKEAVGRRFDKKYVTALCIAKTGTSFGMLVLAPLMQLFLDTYGWRGTMLLLGGISFHLVVCGALMITTEKHAHCTQSYHMVPRTDKLSAHNATIPNRCTDVWSNIVQNFDVRLLLNLRYWCVTITYCCSQLSFDMWIVYFVSMAQTKGFTPGDAAIFVTVGGVGHLTARSSQGFILDRWLKSYCVPMVILISISAAMFYATPWLSLYWTMMASSVLVLFSLGAVLCLFEVLYKEILGVDLLAGALGWAGIKIAILRFTLLFLPGWIYDVTGSYNMAFILIGIMQSVSLIPLIILRYFKIIR